MQTEINRDKVSLWYFRKTAT